MKCRFCENALSHTFLDLGFAPPSNAYLSATCLKAPEQYFPLRVKVCDSCWLVQTEDYAAAGELFNADYAYFSSTSIGWMNHAARYVDMIVDRLGLSESSLVLEVASNDGYLLRNFVECGIPCLGIEPTSSTADAAEALGIPVIREFFTEQLAVGLARAGQRADLIIGNNVYAHVPDIKDFTLGLKSALKVGGTITLEFPHLMELVQETQFDTVYHEHFSYLSLFTVVEIFAAVGLRIFDVEQIPTHGGSLRIYGCHQDDARQDTAKVQELLDGERRFGLQTLDTYLQFQLRAERVKDDLLMFLLQAKREGKHVAAYGAAAKGNTLLNFAGVKPDLISVVFDAAPSKQGKYMPGSHIPIVSPSELRETVKDYILILPWNIAAEINSQISQVDSDVRIVTAVPRLEVK